MFLIYTMADLSLFRNAGTAEILVYLLSNPGKRKVDIRTSLKLGSNTAVRAHALLIENNLIAPGKNIDQQYFLTEKGKEIAQYLQKINEILLRIEYEDVVPGEDGHFYYISKDGKKIPVRILGKDGQWHGDLDPKDSPKP